MSDPILKQAALVRAITQDRVQWTTEHRRILKLLHDRQPIPQDTSQAILKDVHLVLAMFQFVIHGTNEITREYEPEWARKEEVQ
jgi:hypothetical protein